MSVLLRSGSESGGMRLLAAAPGLWYQGLERVNFLPELGHSNLGQDGPPTGTARARLLADKRRVEHVEMAAQAR